MKVDSSFSKACSVPSPASLLFRNPIYVEKIFDPLHAQINDHKSVKVGIDLRKGGWPYTEDFSGGVDNGGSGNFSSTVFVITSESAIHLSSSFTIGTFPSGLILRNLD